MAYKRSKIEELGWPPATLATFATLQPENRRNVATVATVAGTERQSAPKTVATVANVAEAMPVSAKPAPASDPAPVVSPKSDAELYADALKRHSPGSYGSIGIVLGWGMTRAANAETILREAGRIKYDHTGRGVFADGPIPSRLEGKKS